MAERFPTLYDASGGPEACWPWQAEITKAGYGRITDYWEKRLAHRYSWEIHNGCVIPDGMVVMHTCDVRICVNPAHLRLGTHKENTADMIAKGRAHMMGPKNPRRGSENPRAKYTEEQILEIRRRYAEGGVTLQALADEYATTKTGIHKIVKRLIWKHI
jgi:hypothetical protein